MSAHRSGPGGHRRREVGARQPHRPARGRHLRARARSSRRLLIDRLGALGYTARPFDPRETGLAQGRQRGQGRCSGPLAVAGFAAGNVMLLSVSVWSGADAATRDLFHWLSAMIALPAVAYAGRPFFRSAVNALRLGRINMDVPISLGVLLASAMSLFETINGARPRLFRCLRHAALLPADGTLSRPADAREGPLGHRAARVALGRGRHGDRARTDCAAIVPARDLKPGMSVAVAAGEPAAGRRHRPGRQQRHGPLAADRRIRAGARHAPAPRFMPAS